MGTFKILDLMVTLIPAGLDCGDAPSAIYPLCVKSTDHPPTHKIIEQLDAQELLELRRLLQDELAQVVVREKALQDAESAPSDVTADEIQPLEEE